MQVLCKHYSAEINKVINERAFLTQLYFPLYRDLISQNYLDQLDPLRKFSIATFYQDTVQVSTSVYLINIVENNKYNSFA